MGDRQKRMRSKGHGWLLATIGRKWDTYGLLQNGPVSYQDLTLKTQLEAVNGKKMLALEVFAHALRFFKEHALQVCCSSQPADWSRGTLAPYSLPLPSSHPVSR